MHSCHQPFSLTYVYPRTCPCVLLSKPAQTFSMPWSNHFPCGPRNSAQPRTAGTQTSPQSTHILQVGWTTASATGVPRYATASPPNVTSHDEARPHRLRRARHHRHAPRLPWWCVAPGGIRIQCVCSRSDSLEPHAGRGYAEGMDNETPSKSVCLQPRAHAHTPRNTNTNRPTLHTNTKHDTISTYVIMLCTLTE